MPFIRIDNRLRRPIHVVSQSGVRSPLADYEVIAGKHNVEVEVEDGGEIDYGVALRPGTIPTKTAARLIWEHAGGKTRYRVRSKSIGVRARLLRFQQPVIYRLYSMVIIVRLALAATVVTVAAISGVALASQGHYPVGFASSAPTPTQLVVFATDVPTMPPTNTSIPGATVIPTATTSATMIPTVPARPVASSTPKPGPSPITATPTFTPTVTPTLVPSPDIPLLSIISPTNGSSYPFVSDVTVTAFALHSNGTLFDSSQITWSISAPQPGFHFRVGNPMILSLYCPAFCDSQGHAAIGTYHITAFVTGSPPFNILTHADITIAVFIKPPPIH